jgi:amino acid permease
MPAVMTEKKIPQKAQAANSIHEQHVGCGTVQNVQVEKSFNLWSTLGISFSITSTPIAIGTYLSVSIGVGGSPVFFFGYILAVCMNLCICASLAEMAAVYPHSSGKPFLVKDIITVR